MKTIYTQSIKYTLNTSKYIYKQYKSYATYIWYDTYIYTLNVSLHIWYITCAVDSINWIYNKHHIYIKYCVYIVHIQYTYTVYIYIYIYLAQWITLYTQCICIKIHVLYMIFTQSTFNVYTYNIHCSCITI